MPKLTAENGCAVDSICCEAVPIARVWMFAVRISVASSKWLFFRFFCCGLFAVKIAPNDTTIYFSRGRSMNQMARLSPVIERRLFCQVPNKGEAKF